MILFLDFDGVLHPDAVYLERGRPVLRAPGQLLMWAPLLETVLATVPQVRLVLSTSWARHLGYSRARAALPPSLQEKVIGATWHSRMARHPEGFHKLELNAWDQATRYQQIRRYVDRAALTHWLALDDQPEGWAESDASCLVQTQGHLGLSEPQVLYLLQQRLQEGCPLAGA